MKVLVACEHSGGVRRRLRELGHEAFSCDLAPTDDGHSEHHIVCDVRHLLDVQLHKWDMILAFPPCTHLAASGAKHFAKKREDGRQQQGIDLFLAFTKLPCKWAIENPVGIMSNIFRKPDQIIQPFQFGDSFRKTTCLWLNGLAKLTPTKIVDQGELYTLPDGRTMPRWYTTKGRHRQITFPGIAAAMANQWAGKA